MSQAACFLTNRIQNIEGQYVYHNMQKGWAHRRPGWQELVGYYPRLQGFHPHRGTHLTAVAPDVRVFLKVQAKAIQGEDVSYVVSKAGGYGFHG